MQINEDLVNRLFKYTDINEHYPLLFSISEQCDSIVELGGISRFETSWIFALSNPKSLITVDPDPSCVTTDHFKELNKYCHNNGVNHSHQISDTRTVCFEPTDLLFIDSIHTADHVKAELLAHSFYVNKYIILHDTSVYGEFGEYGVTIGGIFNRVPGIKIGINEFLQVDNSWKIIYEYGHNNGLTVLARISK